MTPHQNIPLTFQCFKNTLTYAVVSLPHICFFRIKTKTLYLLKLEDKAVHFVSHIECVHFDSFCRRRHFCLAILVKKIFLFAN